MKNAGCIRMKCNRHFFKSSGISGSISFTLIYTDIHYMQNITLSLHLQISSCKIPPNGVSYIHDSEPPLDCENGSGQQYLRKD